MSYTKLVRAATLDRIGDLVDDTAGVHLRDLPPFTTLLAWTMNSVYRVVITQVARGLHSGGAFFPDSTSAYLDGADFLARTTNRGNIPAPSQILRYITRHRFVHPS